VVAIDGIRTGWLIAVCLPDPIALYRAATFGHTLAMTIDCAFVAVYMPIG
jgi:hypothetical protein